MQELFEFLFGAMGRINRAQYWCSLVMFSVAGLFAAAAIAAPRFIVMVVLVFNPWLIWGFAIRTERLHDRYTCAWWLLVFYVVPGVLGHFAKAAWFAEGVGMVLHYVLALASFAFTIWGFVEIGCLHLGAQH